MPGLGVCFSGTTCLMWELSSIIRVLERHLTDRSMNVNNTRVPI